ncbi:T9SS C-terminal target domain-containing [Micractinium conductrix]|uniref:T9SS C-terminal target domain-containing n=1 Tax=Micractinium conductrix TaxID=554055 RepID=A0A2P6VCF4_9CHLO|nr:T9SS C-terminal target domain-containing [Micractinium conductrix]|eukprot:PSC71772.1 T9SS C-terminal target domain-containing [Micractinium conductrix]
MLPAVMLLLLAASQGVLAKLDGAWIDAAVPARMFTTKEGPSGTAECACAPDPLLPNPACILCRCPTGASQAVAADLKKHGKPDPSVARCGLPRGSPRTRILYSTGVKATCRCGPDPFLKNPAWRMCHCPPPDPIPTLKTYSAWPAPKEASPSLKYWLRCEGRYALCSMANCTMDFPGAKASKIPLAACGCIIATASNGLGANSQVDPTYILSKPLADTTERKCPDGAASRGCRRPNCSPICRAITDNTIYGGEYDYVSTFKNSPSLGGFNKLCIKPGVFAQCMTAACYNKPAFDGSPITCYCPVYKAPKYLLGSPLGIKPSSIAQAVPGATGSSPQPEPPPPPLPESSGAAGSPATVPPAALLVPVLLSAAPGGGGVAINASSGAVVDAGGLNIIRCLRYAAGFNASSGLYAPPGDGAGPPPQPVALPPGSRPPLNLTRCISRITVVATRGPTLTVQVRVAALAGALPPGTLQVSAGAVESVGLPTVRGAFQIFEAVVRLSAPNTPCNISVPAGALSDAVGEPTAASNMLVAVWDQQGPQPVIKQLGKYATTEQPRFPLFIDFGERVLTTNPLRLFQTTGIGRLDVIYDLLLGRIYLVASVATPLNVTTVTVTVPANVTTDVMDQPNSAASFTLVYLPTTNASTGAGSALNAIFATSTSTFIVGTVVASVAAPNFVVPTGNNLGAMGSRAQATFLISQLALPSMPMNYRKNAAKLSYISFDFPLPTIDGGGGGGGRRRKGSGSADDGDVALGDLDLEGLDEEIRMLLERLLQEGLPFPPRPLGVLLLPGGGVVQFLVPLDGNGAGRVLQGPPGPTPAPVPLSKRFQRGTNSGYFLLEGDSLRLFYNGMILPPINLTGLWDLASPGGAGRRRLVQQGDDPALTIASIDCDGVMVVVVMDSSNSFDCDLRVPVSANCWAPVRGAEPASLVSVSRNGAWFFVDVSGQYLVQYSQPRGSNNLVMGRWAMPSNACTDVAVAGDLLVAAVCPGNGVHLLDAAPGSQGAFRPAPGVAACSLAFDSEGFLWLALYSGACSGVGYLRPSSLDRSTGIQTRSVLVARMSPVEASGDACDLLDAGDHSTAHQVAVYCFKRKAKDFKMLSLRGKALPDFTTLEPTRTTVLPTLDCWQWEGDASCTELGTDADADGFAVLLTGTLTVPATGTWSFFLYSDDGSRLVLSNQTSTMTIDSDGLNGMTERFGSFPLLAGEYAIRLEWFDGAGTEAALLRLEWSGPYMGSDWAVVTSAALRPEWSIAGAIAAVQSIARAIAAVQSIAGAIAAVQPIAGAIAAVQPIAGAIAAVQSIAGAIAAVQSIAGAITAVQSIAGAIAAPSSPPLAASGLLARIYTDWQADVLPTNFSALTPAHTAVLLVPDCYFGFSVQNCTELGSLRNDNNIAMLMTGTLVVPAAGTWTFYLTSDDGSRLTLFNNTMTKNNTINYDNTHEMGDGERTETWQLQAGAHGIRLEWFQQTNVAGFRLEWRGPLLGSPRVVVPTSALQAVDLTFPPLPPSPPPSPSPPPKPSPSPPPATEFSTQGVDACATQENFSVCQGCDACADGACICISGQCRCQSAGDMSCSAAGQEYCGVCGVCDSGAQRTCKSVLPLSGQGTYANRLCFADAGCPVALPTCIAGGCNSLTMPALGYCTMLENASPPVGGRRLQGLRGTSVDPAYGRSLPRALPQRHRRLDSRQLSALLHAEYWAAQLAARSARQLTAADGPPPVAPVAPAPNNIAPAAPALLGTEDGGAVYVVTTTGLETNNSAAAAVVLPDALAQQLTALVDQLQSALTIGGSSASPSLTSLWNTLVWVTVALVACVAAHAGVRALLIWRRWRVPSFFMWPRPELILCYFVLPILAAQGAQFAVSDSPGEAAAGVIFGFLIPLSVCGVTVYLVIKHLALVLPTRRRAYYVAEGPSHKAAAAPSHQQPGNEGEGLQPAPSGTLDASEADGGPHPAALAGTSGSAAGKLARSSPGAASDASSAASSGLGASLLRRPSQQRTARQPPEQQQPDAPQQPPALRHSVPLRTRLRRWCMRYFVTPVFGYVPGMQGEWVSPDGYEPCYVGRYGVLFETSRGPDATYSPGTFEWDPATGRYDRGSLVTATHTHAQQAHETAKTLGVSVQMLKLVLFAQLAATLGEREGSSALLQVIPLLSLTLLYWLYVRLFVPMNVVEDIIAEGISCAADVATFVCCILVAVLPPTSVDELNRIGIAMLAFQLTGMACTLLPGCVPSIVRLVRWITSKFHGPLPEDQLADAVWAVMEKDPHILSRKFADRWLLKVHGRGLNQRALHINEQKQTLLPFEVNFRPVLDRTRTIAFGNRKAAAEAAEAAVAAAGAGAGTARRLVPALSTKLRARVTCNDPLGRNQS